MASQSSDRTVRVFSTQAGGKQAQTGTSVIVDSSGQLGKGIKIKMRDFDIQPVSELTTTVEGNSNENNEIKKAGMSMYMDENTGTFYRR